MSAPEKFVQPAIPKFDGHYDFWSMTMENFLRSKELWQLVEEGIPKLGATPTEAQRRNATEANLKDMKVKNYLFQAIDREVLETVLDKSTSQAIWRSMQQKYQGSTRVKRAQLQALRREFELLNMKDGEKIDSYLGRTLTVVNKMKVNGETVDSSTVVSKILRSLTPNFNYVVCSIEEANDLSTLSLDELHGSLLVHEQRMESFQPDEQVLKVIHDDRSGASRGRGRGNRGRGRGHGRQPFNKALVECFQCHKLGHFQYECPRVEKQAHYAACEGATKEEDEILLVAYEETTQSVQREDWFLDSGCSNHMTGNKQWFTEIHEEGLNKNVKLGNDTTLNVVARGNIQVQINGVTHVISNVYYVPELKTNLLSLGQLQEKGLAILIQNGTCKIFHPDRGLIIHTNMRGNRMFYVTVSMTSQHSQCLQVEDNPDKAALLWHKRFGHLNFKGLSTLANKQMVIGLPFLKTPKDICTTCLIGKQHRDVIPKQSSWRAAMKLQLIHADVCGPISPASHSNKRYILSFVDDYSRKTWIYFLHAKSETFNAFKNFKAYVEKEAGTHIVCLRTDRGGEFNSKEFSIFCNHHGIFRQLTAAYTPQQNGVAERKNRTIMNAVRTVLHDKQVPKSFWPEAVRWCVHVQNRSPTSAVDQGTPEEVWSGVKPCVDYFRTFGCVAHVHIPDQKRSKLDAKSQQCILLGVSDESKAYKLYNPITKKVIVSRDVVFEENKSWNWNAQVDGGTLLDLDLGDKEEIEIVESASQQITVNHDQPEILEPTSDVASDPAVEGRAIRTRRQPSWMIDYETNLSVEEESLLAMMITDSIDPQSFEEAYMSQNWREAMDTEMKAIEKNNTWELVELPDGVKPIGVKWVFKTKFNEHGQIEKYKARLVAKGYAQQYGINYTEVFAPVARLDTVRVLLAVTAQYSWEVFQLDVKSAFLHGELQEEVYVQQPAGFITKGKENHVYKLRKALYGLRQAPRTWYSKIEAYFAREKFVRCSSEHTLFTKRVYGKFLIVSLYVDDLIFAGNCKDICEEFKSSMQLEFDMTDLGKMRHFLGIEVIQNEVGIFICQKQYAREILLRFNMLESNSVRNPMVPGTILSKDDVGAPVDVTKFKQAVGSLMYLTATRPDLMYGVSLISRYMANPKESHWAAAKRIFRYLKGTIDHGLFYQKGKKIDFTAYSDSNYAGDLDDRRSTSGSVFMMGTTAVSWASKKQPVVSLSTTEAEYIAAASCACQCIWLRRILKHLGLEEKEATKILCDNNSTIQLSKNPVLHGRSKHIAVRFHFLRDLVNEQVVQLKYCNTNEQVADVMTKAVKLDQFEKFRRMLGVVDVSEIS